jgi:hypothetical protein
MARPGLEPGTPRFSVAVQNRSNQAEMPAYELVCVERAASQRKSQFATFGGAFGHRDRPECLNDSAATRQPAARPGHARSGELARVDETPDVPAREPQSPGGVRCHPTAEPLAEDLLLARSRAARHVLLLPLSCWRGSRYAGLVRLRSIRSPSIWSGSYVVSEPQKRCRVWLKPPLVKARTFAGRTANTSAVPTSCRKPS